MNELKKLAGQDWPKIRPFIEPFEVAAQEVCADRSKLLDLTKRALIFEVKYVPILNEKVKEQLPFQELCLVTSVGTRIQPVLLSIAILKPKSVVFVHTKESKAKVDEITSSKEWKDLFPDQQPFKVKIQIDPVDTTKTYEQLANVVIQGRKNNWVIDITGGRKVMAATLSAFGFWRRIPIVYLLSKEIHGVPKPFSERLVCIDNPYNTYGDPLLKTADSAFNNHQFSIAIEALEQLQRTVSLVGLDHMASIASGLIKCYMLWDHFEHSNDKKAAASKFYKGFEHAVEQYRRFGYKFFDSNSLDVNTTFIKQLQSAYKSSRPSLVDEYRMVDIFCNSGRKADQKLFDDAVARLYRCTEMAATIMLRKMVPEFNPDKVNWDKLRNIFAGTDLDSIFVQKSKNAQNKVTGLPYFKQIGLVQQIILSATIAEAILQDTQKYNDGLVTAANNGIEFYKIYDNVITENKLFQLRNRSILAHGTKPLGEELYREFSDATGRFCQCAIGKRRWKELRSQANFPKIKFVSQY